MAINPDIRIKIRGFFRKYYRIIIVVAFVLLLIITINKYLTRQKKPSQPETSYNPHALVASSTGTTGKQDSVPTKVANEFESFIEKYVGYCNTGDYVDAYNLISEDCRKNFFGNSYDDYVSYVLTKFSTKKNYAIQGYSKYNNKYIYTVKLYDNFLATGLTNQKYRYVEEKMAIYYDDNKNLVIDVGNYMGSKDLQFQNSNDYMKAEVTSETDKYGFVVYNLKITNRSNYTIVIKDGNGGENELYIKIGEEVRNCNDDINIVVAPGETRNYSVSFPKFYDSDLKVESLGLNSVRVMENYTGDPDNAEEEINNAVDKFSMVISMQ